MTVRKSDNKWLVDIRPEGHEGKRVRKKFDTKGEALRYEAFIKSKAIKGEWNPAPADNRKLSDLVTHWHTAHGQHLKDGERRKNKLLTICTELNEPRARRLKPSDFTKYRNSRIQQGITPKTVNNELSYLNAVYNELSRTHYIDYDNPLKSVRMIRIDDNELTYLEKPQITELLTTIEKFSQNNHVLLVTKLSLATGARWGEAERLTLSRLKRQIASFTETKSGKNRSVPISVDLYNELKDHLTEFGSFGTSSISAFRRAMDQTSIELPKGQMAHVLRHTFASHFMINGGNILTLQRILGHANINQTMRYAHLSPDHLEEAVKLNPLDN